MKKRSALFLIVSIIVLNQVYAQSMTQELHNTEIAEAFACVDNNIKNSGAISLGEAVFAALSGASEGGISEVADKISGKIQERKIGQSCYAETGTKCRVKDTAQVALAKMWMDRDAEAEINWLENQTGAIQDLIWYLQITIDNNLPGECVVKYKNNFNTIKVKEDLKLEGNPGSCLEIVNSDYWLRIKDACIDETFEISCGNGNFTGFLTNLIYKKKGEETTFVSSTTNRKSANAWTTEEIKALCFKENGKCDYEASLWASFALYKADRDTENYAPYLRALSSGANERFFPGAFLFRIIKDTKLTDEQYNNILSEQRPGGLFRVGNTPYNEFYDTALAMMALGSGQGADAVELKESVVPGLFNKQGNDGCFGSPRDTAFILHASGWSRQALLQSCAEAGERTSLEKPVCCSGATELSNAYVGENGECIDNGGEYGYCSDVSDNVCGENENICNSQSDCSADVEANTCAGGQWFAGDPVHAINTSEEEGYCDLVDEDDGWENGCCVSGWECVGSGSNSVCQKVPGADVRENKCYQGKWYDEQGEEHNGVNEKGYCHLEDNENYPYGCCPQGYECSYGENQSESICEGRGGGGSSVQTDCSLAGYYCVADPFDCLAEGGVRKRDLNCPGFDICCTIDIAQGETCTDKGGIVCQEDEQCTGAIEFSTTGPCCTGGVCEEESEDDDGGSEITDNTGIVNTKDSNVWWWVFFFSVLILLVLLGIIYRNKLRVFFFKMKGKAKTSKIPPQGAVMRRAPPNFGRPAMQQRIMPQRIMPSGRPPVGASIRRKPASEKEKEMEETLRKLKEMSE